MVAAVDSFLFLCRPGKVPTRTDNVSDTEISIECFVCIWC